MFPETKSRETSGLEGKQTSLVSEGPYNKCFFLFRLSWSKNKDCLRETTAQLYPDGDTFEIDQGT